jgi:hypothetical protein
MTQQSSAMSITQLCHLDEPEDPNVKLENNVGNDIISSK